LLLVLGPSKQTNFEEAKSLPLSDIFLELKLNNGIDFFEIE